jgi:hypothetical protein
VVGAVINFLGVPAGLIGNELSIRYGLRTIATLVFALSAVAGGLFGFTAMLPYIAVFGLSLIAGFARSHALHRGSCAEAAQDNQPCQRDQGEMAERQAPRPSVPRSGNGEHARSEIGKVALHDRALFLHRLRRGISRDATVRRHARPIRRDLAARRLAAWVLCLGNSPLPDVPGQENGRHGTGQAGEPASAEAKPSWPRERPELALRRRQHKAGGSSTLHQDIQDICSVDYTGVRDDRPTPAASKTDCTNSVLALL